ncbi:MAG: hypothetical protein OXB88_07480 [Bacteriovoracales bacterium]|nr:hypothetical protein [Bacteriovoracales bacterium]
MENNTFRLKSWMNPRLPLATLGGSVVLPAAREKDSFHPKKYLIPEWSGESLSSKEGMQLSKIFGLIALDVKSQLLQTHFNKSLKEEVYNEFLSYAEHRALHCPDIDSFSSLFDHLGSSDSIYSKDLEGFKTAFASKIATVYLFKIRFLVKLSQTLNHKIQKNDLLNPNSYLTKLFRRGSSSQLESLAITANHYSWYRPKINWPIEELLYKIDRIYERVSIAELQKIFSHNNLRPTEEMDYSHALSHHHFGTFLIQLITEFPEWIGKGGIDSAQSLESWTVGSPAHDQKKYRTLTLQYTGDHLESLSLSHWLAQGQVSSTPGKFAVCPEFCSDEYRYGTFARLAYELHFLCFLTDNAKRFHEDPISYICDIYRMKEGSKRIAKKQQSFFDPTIFKDTRFAYDRIVLNLTQFPKNNPHHFLISKIQDKISELKNDGFLVVLSAKKLFIPSLSEKVEELLKILKIEGVLTFKNLKGKGEIPPYLYILSKRKESEGSKLSLENQFLVNSVSGQNEKIQKHPCFSFRINGELKTFGRFSMINKAFRDFFKNKKSNTTPIYRKELSKDLSFEFYQDAIINGRLVNTTNKDTSKVTHPNFFKSLIRSCYQMGHFFQIDPIPMGNEKSKTLLSQDLLGIKFEPEDQYSDILVLDYKNKSNLHLEFVPKDTLKSKQDEYGRAFYSYFGLIPKIKNININLFRYFFKTPIGKQIIHLSLGGELNKLRARTSSLLVPRFFEQSKLLPGYISEGLHPFHLSTKELLKHDSKELLKDYLKIEKYISDLSSNYPWHIMGYLILFEQKLDNALEDIQSSENFFENKTFIQSLLQYPSHPLYPNNSEVFVKFHIEESQDLNFPLKSITLHGQNDLKKGMYELALHNQNGKVLSLFSHKNLIKFLDFILTKMIGEKILNVLFYTKIPTPKDLNQLIENQKDTGKNLQDIKLLNQKLLVQLLNRQLY